MPNACLRMLLGRLGSDCQALLPRPSARRHASKRTTLRPSPAPACLCLCLWRVQVMANEMSRWQQQAHLTAAAVMDAKNEVLERKRELDHTKEKMDRCARLGEEGRWAGL